MGIPETTDIELCHQVNLQIYARWSTQSQHAGNGVYGNNIKPVKTCTLTDYK